MPVAGRAQRARAARARARRRRRRGGAPGLFHIPTRTFTAEADAALLPRDEEHAALAARALSALYRETELVQADALENLFNTIMLFASPLDPEGRPFDVDDFARRAAASRRAWARASFPSASWRCAVPAEAPPPAPPPTRPPSRARRPARGGARGGARA